MENRLYLLPFDHRSSFIHDLYGFTLPLTPEQSVQITQAKRVIYDGFLLAGIAPQKAGILVDEEFGTALLKDAREKGFVTACPIEKSGQAIFDLEYGEDWRTHVERADPIYVKALVRYNPEGNAAGNTTQQERLRMVSQGVKEAGRKFMFELLVPGLPEQLAAVNNDEERYDAELRPALMVKAMHQLQAAGITPDIWKVEGVNSPQAAAELAQAAGTAQLIVLGRDAGTEQVDRWLTIAAQTPNFIGFAVGRTSFEEPLKRWKAGEWSVKQASEEIADRFRHWGQVFESVLEH